MEREHRSGKLLEPYTTVIGSMEKEMGLELTVYQIQSVENIKKYIQEHGKMTKDICYFVSIIPFPQGLGTNFYSDDDIYEGHWYADKRNGWGRMYYADCSTYEGEWFDDSPNGQGMLRLANENRYEGIWKNGKKHGAGKFFFFEKGQLYEGVWVDDIAKCGKMIDFGREEAIDPTSYPIPQIKLRNPTYVLERARSRFLDKNEEDT
ncbi:MORN repeat-containing protein 3 isoform X2 [Scyliorhinus canicula]|uniref:MORN repeat-containing protein 3 isoform X2 n=1 Tax=Scyliorhinus canicula TaxID=7830 RepID=UPI0018F532F6|nr:MORN repeat-containing protein 3 isoform X2 [Scyliorhinus canicula]